MGLFTRKKKTPSRRPKLVTREVEIWLTAPEGYKRTVIPAKTPLTAVREPDNRHDKNAVAVHFGNRGRVGYLSRGDARRAAAEIDAGTKYTVKLDGRYTLTEDDMWQTSGTLRGWTN